MHDSLRAGPHDPDILLSACGEEVVGFFVILYNFSTFMGKAGMYIEDLFIRQRYRGQGNGTAMLKYIMQLAAEQDMARLEWQVAAWNTPAQAFYKKMGALVDERYKVVRVEGDKLQMSQGVAE
jgi:GNAT superfamily N-acetyltransferase